jgi:glycosyltransferase involved in cell wall biosynthesis
MQVGVALGGTDLGVSGIGRFVRAGLPRLARRVEDAGGTVTGIGTPAELAAFSTELGDSRTVELSLRYAKPGANALWHFFAADSAARAAGVDVLLFPAANRRFAWAGQIPTVAVVHDLAQFHVPGKYDVLRTLYAKQVLARALRKASALVAVSDATRDDMVRVLGCAQRDVRVVHNGVDTDLFRSHCGEPAALVELRRSQGIDRPYLLYACRLEHPGKNHLRLLRAFAESRLRDSHQLVLAGKDWGALEAIREEVRRLDLEAAVRIVGFVDDASLAAMMRSATAVLVLGLYEGFGLPALEGLAVGRPVVASKTGALPEVVGPLGVLCEPMAEDSIRRALERVVSDDALRCRVAREGPDRARAWSWDRTAEGLMEACRSAIA